MVDRLILIAKTHRRLLTRFLFIGVINTAFSYSIYCALIAMGNAFPIAGIVALALGVVWSFTTNGKLVFQQKLQGRFLKYLATWGVVYIIYVLTIWVAIGLGLDVYLGGALATLMTIPVAYLLQHFFVFVQDT